MLVEHLDVIAGVLLRREGVHLSTDRIDRLGNVFGAPGPGPLEEHVLDEMRDAALLLRLVPRSAGEPHADADGAHMRHSLGEKTETVRKHVADDEWLRHECVGNQPRSAPATGHRRYAANH